MTWGDFWKSGERVYDRLLTVMATLTILKSGEYIQIRWTPIVVLGVISLVGAILCVFLAALCDPARDAES